METEVGAFWLATTSEVGSVGMATAEENAELKVLETTALEEEPVAKEVIVDEVEIVE